ncbi:MAG: hypothetical protein KAU03_06470, partial [Candidatus Altiarchaeales archaeon]|nr:hypothetical protein [Candidatus Altiarchaeales archaeon]
MKNKILIGVGVFLLLMSALTVEAGCKTFHSTSDIENYTTETWFRECDECIYICPSVKGCPKNEHKVRRIYDCETYCDFCQDWDYGCTMPTRGFATCCDPAWCCSWATDGCTGEPTKQVVCGIGDDKWRTIDAGGWMCPTCADLALWHGGIPPILDLNSFDSLSIRDENNFLRSEEATDFTFEVYIEACLNRIPMMNLKVELADALTTAVRSHEYGIYSKHRTLDYTTEVGLLEGVILPNQTEFAKNHEVRGILKGYRPWAWRQRLTGAMEAIVVARGLSIPGFPTTPTPQRIGDLYFSKDFLAGLDLPGGGITCEELITHHQTFTLDVLHKLPKLASTEMCSADDLINYYSSNGVTPQLEA